MEPRREQVDTRPEPSSRFEVTDVAALRALSHPLRMRILGILRLEGEATASQLGRRLGESSGSTSYHLRQLARFGLVEESPHQASRRDRVWRAAHAMTSIDPQLFSDGPQMAALDEFGTRQLERLADQSRRWVGRRADAERAWVSAAGFSDWMVRISPQACAELSARLSDILVELEQRSQGEPDVSWVSVFLAALPMTDEEAIL
jgi:DNA-binding transcriptional ArsR family regulator